MKPKIRGWKEGILTEDLRSVGGTTHKKGAKVRYKKHRTYDEDNFWTGGYEYHYLDQDNYNLVRSGDLLIQSKN